MMAKNHVRMSVAPSVLVLGLSGAPTLWAQGNGEDEPKAFSETKVVIEINATDGDIGFQTLFDADAWTEVTILAPDETNIFQEQAAGTLAEQGLTETTFESDEPLCAPDPDDPDAKVVTLADFLGRFPEGTYQFVAQGQDNGDREGAGELTHQIPAAPDIVSFDGTTITWQPGMDLGKCQDNNLVVDGAIPDPGMVQIVGWEVVVEPVDEEAADPLRVFSIQLPGEGPNMVNVPSQFTDAYRAEGITEFKVEVGAIEASGNRTFSEEAFELEPTNGADGVDGSIDNNDDSRVRDELAERDRDEVRDQDRDDFTEQDRDEVRDQDRDDFTERDRDEVRDQDRDDFVEQDRDEVRDQDRDDSMEWAER